MPFCQNGASVVPSTLSRSPLLKTLFSEYWDTVAGALVLAGAFDDPLLEAEYHRPLKPGCEKLGTHEGPPLDGVFRGV